MQYKKLTGKQRTTLRWQKQRNHIVCQLLDRDPTLLRQDALTIANQRMASKKIRKQTTKP